MEARPLLLALNAGTSSLKAKVYSYSDSKLTLESSARLEGIGRRQPRLRVDDVTFSGGAVGDHTRAAEIVLERLLPGSTGAAERLIAIGHRIVHGGTRFSAPVRITADVAVELDALRELAPLHNPPALGVVRATAARYARVPQYAVFDTAFFAELPLHARELALPAEWRFGRGLRRFGFHGLAHEYLAREARKLPGRKRRLVTLQLGNGCSAAAIVDGRPVETSMGFSPLDGLIMATRPGDLDPGVLLELGRRGESLSTINHVLHRESGLKGLSGASSDVRELLELEAHGHAGATLAMAAFRHRIVKYLGAYAAVMGGLDAIAIGGGIGENAPAVRARICSDLEWLGLRLDASANDDAVGVASRVTAAGSTITVDVIPVDEELLIAERVRDALPVAAPADDASVRSAS
jgi:acetate kinase